MSEDWTKEIAERLQWINRIAIISSEGRDLNDVGRWINHSRNDIANLLEDREVLREALKERACWCPKEKDPEPYLNAITVNPCLKCRALAWKPKEKK